MSGWIKLHRQIVNWEWYSDSKTFRLFLHLLLTANHKDNNYRGKLIKKGCLVTGRELLSAQTGMSVREIRTCLERLKSTNEIAIKTNSKGTEIQVINYEKYQSTTNETTNKRPTNDQQMTTNNNDKNDKEEKEDDKSSIDYNKLLDYINSTFNKKIQKVNDKAKKQFNARLKDYSKDIFKIVIDNLKKDEYHKETNYKFITPEYISREKTIELHSQEINTVTPDNLTEYEKHFIKSTGLTYEQLKG